MTHRGAAESPIDFPRPSVTTSYMPTKNSASSCGCCDGISRRRFLQSTAAAAALLPFGSVVEAADHAAKSNKTSETLVGEFYKTLSEPQREAICFPFGH